MILKKENQILKRKQKSVGINNIDRFFFIAIYRNCRELLDELVIVSFWRFQRQKRVLRNEVTKDPHEVNSVIYVPDPSPFGSGHVAGAFRASDWLNRLQFLLGIENYLQKNGITLGEKEGVHLYQKKLKSSLLI